MILKYMKKQFLFFLILFFVLCLAPIDFIKADDLGGKLKGLILLQVESKGEAWYVDPLTTQRAYLGRPTDAFRIMRELGLGVSEKDFNLFDGYAPKNLSGRILLRVEANGEAYYVHPTDLRMYYLGRPTDAFNVMREQSLGITDEDLNKVVIFQKYKEQTEQNMEDIEVLKQKVDELNQVINSNNNLNLNSSTSAPSKCTEDKWTCGSWSECSENGNQKRACNISSDCQGVNSESPEVTRSCLSTLSNLLEIKSLITTPSDNGARIELSTSIPAYATVSVWNDNYLKAVFRSASGLSTNHIIDITKLESNINYSAEIEIIDYSNNVIKKQLSFTTLQPKRNRNITIGFNSNDRFYTPNFHYYCGLNTASDTTPDGVIGAGSLTPNDWSIYPKPDFSRLELNSRSIRSIHYENLDGVYFKSVKIKNVGTGSLIKSEIEAVVSNKNESLTLLNLTENTAEFSATGKLYWPFEIQFRFNPDGLQNGETFGLEITDLELGSDGSNDNLIITNTFPVQNITPSLAVKCDRIP